MGAKAAPEWYAAVALGNQKQIILRSQRDLSTPIQRALTTLYHEISHIIAREASGVKYNELPLWFNEGLAQYASGEKTWEMQYHLVTSSLLGTFFSFSELTYQFPRSESEARKAYEESFNIISYLLETYGIRSIQEIFRGLRRNQPFEASFHQATGQTVAEFELAWQETMRFDYTWIPVFTGAGTVWGIMSLMFLLAYFRKKKRTDRRLKLMEIEDEIEDLDDDMTYH